MAVISGVDYLAIANDYADARNRMLAAVDDIFDAVYRVVLLDEINPTVDLISEFWNSYLINNVALRSPVTFLSAVRAINNHVLNRTTFTTLDEYFEDQGIRVPQSWADLTAGNGVIVDSSNIA